MREIDKIVTDPSWFIDAIYADQKYIEFYKVTRELLKSSSFLDNRMKVHSFGKKQIKYSVDDLEKHQLDKTKPSINFIFHTSFCRSTLMAKALHIDGVSFSLKEPSALLSLAESFRYTNSLNDERVKKVTLSAILNLLTLSIEESESVVIKPTNFANNILPYIAASGFKILLMYSDLKSYLISILKYGESGKIFARQLYLRLKADCDRFENMDPSKAMLFTDLQVASMVWRQQMELFIEVQNAVPENQVCTLSSDAFKSNPNNILKKTFDFFQMPVTHDAIEKIVNGPVFLQHSKSNKTVDNENISKQNLEIEKKYEDEINATLKWAETVKIKHEVILPMRNNLASN